MPPYLLEVHISYLGFSCADIACVSAGCSISGAGEHKWLFSEIENQGLLDADSFYFIKISRN